tara:strand:- start:3759 stop:3938 length:180 start_codon:yes stop_codon:yes gene_type:complete
MRTKAERRLVHTSQLKTVSNNNVTNTGSNRERIVARKGKVHKIVKSGGKQYFVELKKTR